MLEESLFIRKGGVKTPSFWIYALLSMGLILAVAAFDNWAEKKLESQQNSSFYHVTNREISLFLWSHPHLMRVHAKNKIGYLPGFQYLHRVNIEPGFAEKIAVAPPSLLFSYHTWKRLLYLSPPKREIEPLEFQEFLSCLPEWQDHESGSIEVRHAFFGWKNFYKEGEAINAFKPTFSMLQTFLTEHPHYSRHYWQHILQETTPDYLKTFASREFNVSAEVPPNELAPFLRVALFNFMHE